MTAKAFVLGQVQHFTRMACQLIWYPPGHRQSMHVHQYAQASILLSGNLHEITPSRDSTIANFSLAMKPACAEHAVEFGSNGALILTFNLNPPPGSEASSLPTTPAGWQWQPAGWTRPLVDGISRELHNPTGASGQVVEDMFWDVISSRHGSVDVAAGDRPPPWLDRLKQRLDDTPAGVSVAEAAETAGVHRTHLSRAFRQFYGIPVSSYRRRSQAGIAIHHLTRGFTLADAAFSAGFSDQSHMTRTIKSETCFTPGVLRGFLRNTA